MKKLITWSGRLALWLGLGALVVMLVQGPAYKAGLVGVVTALLKVFPAVVVVGGLAVVLGIVSVAGVKVGGAKALRMGLVGLLAGAGAAAVPLSLQRISQSVPVIHDITTDTQTPPQFVAVVPLRADASNPVSYDPEIAAIQREAYPDIQTIELNKSTADVFAAASRAVESLGWELVAAHQGAGRIEATETTAWFGFKDDVVIRIAARGGKTLVDVRSKSRVGRSDLGVNAKRIRTFRQALIAEAG